MRPISEVKEDIRVLKENFENKSKEFSDELEKIVNICPHPIPFQTYSEKDSEDSCGGSPIYEHTWITYRCSLCEGKWHSKYHKNIEHRPSFSMVVNT